MAFSNTQQNSVIASTVISALTGNFNHLMCLDLTAQSSNTSYVIKNVYNVDLNAQSSGK